MEDQRLSSRHVHVHKHTHTHTHLHCFRRINHARQACVPVYSISRIFCLKAAHRPPRSVVARTVGWCKTTRLRNQRRDTSVTIVISLCKTISSCKTISLRNQTAEMIHPLAELADLHRARVGR